MPGMSRLRIIGWAVSAALTLWLSAGLIAANGSLFRGLAGWAGPRSRAG